MASSYSTQDYCFWLELKYRRTWRWQTECWWDHTFDQCSVVTCMKMSLVHLTMPIMGYRETSIIGKRLTTFQTPLFSSPALRKTATDSFTCSIMPLIIKSNLTCCKSATILVQSRGFGSGMWLYNDLHLHKSLVTLLFSTNKQTNKQLNKALQPPSNTRQYTLKPAPRDAVYM